MISQVMTRTYQKFHEPKRLECSPRKYPQYPPSSPASLVSLSSLHPLEMFNLSTSSHFPSSHNNTPTTTTSSRTPRTTPHRRIPRTMPLLYHNNCWPSLSTSPIHSPAIIPLLSNTTLLVLLRIILRSLLSLILCALLVIIPLSIITLLLLLAKFLQRYFMHLRMPGVDFEGFVGPGVDILWVRRLDGMVGGGF